MFFACVCAYASTVSAEHATSTLQRAFGVGGPLSRAETSTTVAVVRVGVLGVGGVNHGVWLIFEGLVNTTNSAAVIPRGLVQGRRPLLAAQKKKKKNLAVETISPAPLHPHSLRPVPVQLGC